MQIYVTDGQIETYVTGTVKLEGERGQSSHKHNREEMMKDTKKIEQAASLEELFERLDRVIGGLEGEELSLEDSFNLYQEGMELVKCCNRTIDDVEKKVLALDENGESHEF